MLAAQLAHPSFREELEAYFTHRLQTLHEAPASLRETGDQALLPVVPWWQQHIQELKRIWQAIDGDLIAEFRRHAQAGRLELISSAATHGFLPLLRARPEETPLDVMITEEGVMYAR